MVIKTDVIGVVFAMVAAACNVFIKGIAILVNYYSYRNIYF